MRFPTSQYLPWRPAHGHACDVASPTKNPIMKVIADVKNAQTTEETRGSDMVAVVQDGALAEERRSFLV
jgi:hypothetical protein